MKSVCVTKAKAYYIIADGYTECYTFNSREEAESFAEEKAKEYVDKYQADKFFECATNRVFKIIPKT